jgi:hypothetical protein
VHLIIFCLPTKGRFPRTVLSLKSTLREDYYPREKVNVLLLGCKFDALDFDLKTNFNELSVNFMPV